MSRLLTGRTGNWHPEESFYKESPRVIIEFMSDYKADHVEKLFAYQQIESLEEYLAIHQQQSAMPA